ncbi:MAG TPA: 2Fe-2S iron-sulfur cluster-binding protein [Myxococcales bacterium]
MVILVTVRFISADGTRSEAQADPGQRLLELAQAQGMPLEGTCEGQMACSTCHVIVAEAWFDKLPPASDDEEDMLDLAAGACRTSRLACQIVLDETLDGIELQIPGEWRDMQRG